MPKKTIRDLDVAGKRVFIRADFNVPMDDHGHITDERRVRLTIPTIVSVLDRGGAVVVASHLGRPKGKPEEKYSLKPVAAHLAKVLGKPVQFAPDCVGAEADKLRAALKPGAPWVDPRAPDGVTILAPTGQAHPSQYPGLDTGDPLRAGALFDLQTDPGEQHDVAGAHPEIVARLRALSAEFIKASSESRRPKTP
jgi:hypothetical protein